jgi:peptidoglycan/xylan/chitin deacetylase (PgdA/CDA1 family)
VLTVDGPGLGFLATAWPILKRHGLSRATLFFPPSRLGQKELVVPEGRPEPILLPEQLAQLAKDGVELGVQVGLRDKAEDLARGRARLAELSGGPVDQAALPPGGRVDPQLQQAVKKAGFRGAALASGDGPLRAGTPRLAIPRLSIRPDTSLLDVALFVSTRRPE